MQPAVQHSPSSRAENWAISATSPRASIAVADGHAPAAGARTGTSPSYGHPPWSGGGAASTADPSTDRGGGTHPRRGCTKPQPGSAVSSPDWCGPSAGRCETSTASEDAAGTAADGDGHRRQPAGREGGRTRGVEDTWAVARACAAEGPQFGPRAAGRQDRGALLRWRARAPCRAPGPRVLRPRSRRGDRPRSTRPTHLLQGHRDDEFSPQITTRTGVGSRSGGPPR